MTDLTPPTRAQIHPDLVDRLLQQTKADRATEYWGTEPHVVTLDHVEAWLNSLKDYLPGRHRASGTAPTQVVCFCEDVHPQTYDHQVQMVNPFGKTRLIVCIDVCLATTIAELWHQGVETTNSCCGHGTMDTSVCVTEESFPKMTELGWRQDPHFEFVWYPPAAQADPPLGPDRAQVLALAAEWWAWHQNDNATAFRRECATALLALLPTPSDEAQSERCPRCGHAPHDTLGFCPNMASDNDCDCTTGPAPVVPAEPEEETLAAVIARIWSSHSNCTWESTGVNVVWSCGILHPGPSYMQPTTRDRHVAVLVMTQVEADYLSPSQVRARERAAWEAGRKAGAEFEQARWTGADVIGVPRPEVPVKNPFGDDA